MNMAMRELERPKLDQHPAEPAGAIVEARAIDKLYDTGQVQVHALRSVSVAIRRGEMVAIMGPCGCGQDDPAQLPVRT